MKVIYAPDPIDVSDENGLAIFLAGSIEMGVAEKWQDKVIDRLADKHCVILNPRRKQWDSSCEQNINNPMFYEQVNWELDGLWAADEILMYFDPNTKSPITLLELGLFANTTKLVVVCPEGFWRKGNVDIVCERWGIVQIDSLDEYLDGLVEDLL